MDIDIFFKNLWDKYVVMTPQAAVIHNAFLDEHGALINDHVAFRTFNTGPINIAHLEKHILSLGYERFDTYEFREKKLDAVAYIPIKSGQPRIFISELRVEELSDNAQVIINKYLTTLPTSTADDINCFWQGISWSIPCWEDYQSLLNESEYAAWLLVHGLCANHFTISVNHLRHPDVELVNLQVDALGYRINESGGMIKGTPDDLLEQSATLADQMQMTFADGDEHPVTTCYYEFAKRYNDETGKLFQGFIADNADKIFESTDMKS